MTYKQKSLILRHFQKRLEPIKHYKKEKLCNKNAMEYIQICLNYNPKYLRPQYQFSDRRSYMSVYFYEK